MEPILSEGDKVLIRKRTSKHIREGEKAVFHHPQKGYLVCKRCITTPGRNIVFEHSSHDTTLFSNLKFAPARNNVVQLDSISARLYSHVIAYETGNELFWRNGSAFLAGKPLKQYRFSHDWYYFLGDNRRHSIDSRHYGLVPDDFLVGKVKTTHFFKHKYQ